MNQKLLVLCSHAENKKALTIIGGFASEALGTPAHYLDLRSIIIDATGVDIEDHDRERSLRDEQGAYKKEAVAKIADAVKEASGSWPVHMIITDLPEDIHEVALELHLAVALNVEMAFVRLRSARRIKRIVITTGGGPHAFNGLRYGQQAAQSLNAETLALRVIRNSEISQQNGDRAAYCQKIVDLMTMQAAMAGISIPVKTVIADSVSDAIIDECSPDDLLIMGVTSRWRYDQLSGSLPEELARRLRCSLMVVFAPAVKELPLAEVFWERNIMINPEYKDRWDLLSSMVDRLIEDRQLPEEKRAEVIATVYDREFAGSTSTGKGLAIPHAALPHFEGTLGVLAVFSPPIDFGDATDTNFVFMLVTPENDYQEYLTILGKIAKTILQPHTRDALLKASNPVEAMDILVAADEES